ncbi:MAG: hypothetical protein U0518_06065 [Candidatus Gracilibacteria bacterium]
MPLPNLEQKLDTEGLHNFLGRIYPIFRSTLGNKSAIFLDFPVNLKKKPYLDLDGIMYEWGFHHIITIEKLGSEDREFCLPRAKRIRFPRHYIDSVDTLKVWQRAKNNEQKYYISDENFDYLVVLSQRKDYIVLISAFPIDSNRYKQKMLKEYEHYKIDISG